MFTKDIIKFEELTLKSLEPKDVHIDYVNALNNPEINRFLVTVKKNVQTVDSVVRFVEDCIKSKKNYFFGIWHSESRDKIIGTVKLHLIDKNTSDIGICLFDKSFWYKGVGTKSVELISNWAIKNKICQEIIAGVNFKNKASIKLFIKSGYFLYDINSNKYYEDGNSHIPSDILFFRFK